ncbi:MAG: THxN family PEP-CTERM protein [Desulfobulbus sp.]|nr:THxN family PEP-CTERM protein [Desulfobulbus sp.]
MKKVLSVAVLGLFLASASVVQAVPIELTKIDGDWKNPSPAGKATIVNSGSTGGTSTASWGNGDNVSSYVFVSNNTPLNVEADGDLFSIGTFTHNNFPIDMGSSINAIDLLITIQAFDLIDLSATFNYSHNETPNTGGDLANRDIVTITNPILNADFEYGGNKYYFNLFGFSQDDGLTVSNVFKTYENQANAANLYAKVTSEPLAPAPIPEPSTMFLVGTGLAGVAALSRRREWK